MKPSPGLLGGAVATVAVGAAIGLAAERYAVGRMRLRPDPEAEEPFFQLPADRTHSVTADDGVLLHVEEVGSLDAALTVVFVHGYTQQLAVWHYQRLALAADGRARLVFYDQRSHGRSSRSARAGSTIDQLGRDLHSVMDAVAPTGHVVLVGHSMGGMTLMALADQHPELFGPRVVGAALLSTSTGKLAQATFGLPSAVIPVSNRVLPWLTRGMRARPQVFERTRRLGTDLAFLLTRSYAFGGKGISPALVEFVEKMTADTPVDVIAEFYDTFVSHDKVGAVAVLAQVESLVLCGTKDLVTPPDHSEVLAAAAPGAQLVLIEGAGHMVMLERPELVSLHLRALLARAGRALERTA
ncbi:MAG TPA: alpha/beta hydrolase [Mycobacteriales bacterium]|nr:alpha/beta hydrolase [Mycobacteriales bacterium]